MADESIVIWHDDKRYILSSYENSILEKLKRIAKSPDVYLIRDQEEFDCLMKFADAGFLKLLDYHESKKPEE